MTELNLDNFKEMIKGSNLAKSTKKQYLKHIEGIYFGIIQDNEKITFEDIKRFIEKKEEKYSNNYLNAKISVIQFILKQLGKKNLAQELNELRRASVYTESNKEGYLTVREVQKIINSLDMEDSHSLKINNALRYQLAFSLVYDGALTQNEVTSLKVKDINTEDDKINVEGREYRAELSEKSKKLYYEHIKENNLNKNNYLICSPFDKSKAVSNMSLRNNFKKALKQAKIDKEVTIKTLKDSRIVHLIESETDLKEVMKKVGITVSPQGKQGMKRRFEDILAEENMI